MQAARRIPQSTGGVMSGAPMAMAVPLKRAWRPRVGFVGAGWIGQHRMKAILDAGRCDVVGIVEPNDGMAKTAAALASGQARLCGYEELLRSDVDGIVIATPSALHAEQS